MGGKYTVTGEIASIKSVADNIYEISLKVKENDQIYYYEIIYGASKYATKLLKGDMIEFRGGFFYYNNKDVPHFQGTYAELIQ